MDRGEGCCTGGWNPGVEGSDASWAVLGWMGSLGMKGRRRGCEMIWDERVERWRC